MICSPIPGATIIVGRPAVRHRPDLVCRTVGSVGRWIAAGPTGAGHVGVGFAVEERWPCWMVDTLLIAVPDLGDQRSDRTTMPRDVTARYRSRQGIGRGIREKGRAKRHSFC